MDESKRHFIVVDDDKDMRYLVRRVILRHFPAAAISEAGDGLEALSLFERGGADLMIIDHNLPSLNGADLVRELRARDVTIPLVVMSNFAGAGDEAMNAGATSFVDKGEINPCLADHLPTLLPQ